MCSDKSWTKGDGGEEGKEPSFPSPFVQLLECLQCRQMIRYSFVGYFKQFSLSSPDVNKNKGVAETAPLM